MKALYACLMALTMSAFASATFADVDWNDVQRDCERAAEYAGDLAQQTFQLDADFPYRAEMFSKATTARVRAEACLAVVNAFLNGQTDEANAIQLILGGAEIGKEAAEDVEDRADWIESNYNGNIEDTAEEIEDLADDVEGRFRSIINELD